MAFVETTVLFDALLAPKPERTAAQNALKRFTRTIVPVYAFKEMKAGPLKNYVWFHNKLALFSYDAALNALQRHALSPRRYTTATALEAMRAASEATFSKAAEWIERHNEGGAKPSEMFKDHLRLSLKRIIYRGWRGRRKLTTEVVSELDCYTEAPLSETPRGTIEIQPTACEVSSGCHLARMLSADNAAIEAMCKSIETSEQKPENVKRLAALRKARGEGWRNFEDKHCRHIGDAAFAFLAPLGVPILTTNVRDLEPLAACLGKTVERP